MNPEWQLKQQLAIFIHESSEAGGFSAGLRLPDAPIWFEKAAAESNLRAACFYMLLSTFIDRSNPHLWVNAFLFAWNWHAHPGPDGDEYTQWVLANVYFAGRHIIGPTLDAMLLDQIERENVDLAGQTAMKEVIKVLAKEADRVQEIFRRQGEKGYFTFRLFPPDHQEE